MWTAIVLLFVVIAGLTLRAYRLQRQYFENGIDGTKESRGFLGYSMFVLNQYLEYNLHYMKREKRDSHSLNISISGVSPIAHTKQRRLVEQKERLLKDEDEGVELVEMGFRAKLTKLRGGMAIPELRGCPNNAILKLPLLANIYSWLPTNMRQKDLFNVYSMQRDGASLKTMYDLCASEQAIVHGMQRNQQFDMYRRDWSGASLLLVMDSGGYIFGYFSLYPWRLSKNYYGCGENFVFQLFPDRQKFDWSQRNEFFQMGQEDYIAVGGGDHFALWLDQTMREGSSRESSTFNNRQLAGTPEFKVFAVEIWALV